MKTNKLNLIIFVAICLTEAHGVDKKTIAGYWAPDSAVKNQLCYTGMDRVGFDTSGSWGIFGMENIWRINGVRLEICTDEEISIQLTGNPDARAKPPTHCKKWFPAKYISGRIHFPHEIDGKVTGYCVLKRAPKGGCTGCP